jgi:CBS domain-containing protein
LRCISTAAHPSRIIIRSHQETPVTDAEQPLASLNADLSPSSSLLANLRQELMRYPPFAQMQAGDVDFFLRHARQNYFAPEEILIEPGSGPVTELFLIRRGAVIGERGLAELSGGAFHYEPGELFPVGAALAHRAVTVSYRAVADTFVLALPLASMHALAVMSPPFADFLNRRILKFLDLSRRALQVAYASQALAEQSLETPLGDVARRAPVNCLPDTPLREALGRMHQQHIGSMLVADEGGRPLGILTRHDILGRITLAALPLDTPISQVMVQPVLTLSHEHTALDAALLMSKHGIRHVPVTRGGVAVGVVSERDLFAMQRLSLKQVSTSIRSAADVEMLKIVAQDIRRFAHSLLGQGVHARQLTALISHLNDVLTLRLLEIKAGEHGIALSRLCWLALGSEGRSEQTIATDQDNALILPDDTTPDQREAALRFARDVNGALDACGYPLCRGGIMAGEPACCLTLRQWRERFAHWIEHGAPADLLNASIYFDFRPLAGDARLADSLRQEVSESARRAPRFIKQLAVNALLRSPPLNWTGSIAVDEGGMIDLKLQGAAIFVDVARIYSLSRGLAATNTRERLDAVGPLLGIAPSEYQAWVSGFEFVQTLRLRVQLEGTALSQQPNHLKVDRLNDIDRRILRESFRVARSLQQRLQLDYER